MVAARVPSARISSWLLERKLYRKTAAGVTADLVRCVLIRTGAAILAFGSMTLIAWVAAFARQVLALGWSGFRTLDASELSTASTLATNYEGGLVPVLAVWAALLLLAPIGCVAAFRAAAVAAGVLGALYLVPPSFVITPAFAGFARGLADATRSWDAIWVLVASVPAAFVLHRGALTVFEHLDQLSPGRIRRHIRTPFALVYAARAGCVAVTFVVLLAATWTGTVVWLAASPAHGDTTTYGAVISDYLLLLGIVAVCVACSTSAQGWLTAVIPLAAWLGAAANVAPLPRDLASAAWPREAARVAALWGSDSLWGALFVGFPVCLAGVYLVGALRQVGTHRL